MLCIFTVAHHNLPVIPFPHPHIHCHGLVPCTRRPTCDDKKHIGNHREDISHGECLVFSVCQWLDFCRQGNSPDVGLLALASILSKPLSSQSIVSAFMHRQWSLWIIILLLFGFLGFDFLAPWTSCIMDLQHSTPTLCHAEEDLSGLSFRGCGHEILDLSRHRKCSDWSLSPWEHQCSSPSTKSPCQRSHGQHLVPMDEIPPHQISLCTA